MEISNILDAAFKTLVIRMLKECSEELSSIKKIQSETKDTLIEINNLQGNNSRVDEAENQINDLEHKEAKTNQTEQQEEKRIQKNMGLVKEPLGQFQAFQHSYHRGIRKRTKQNGDKQSIRYRVQNTGYKDAQGAQ